MTVYSSYSLAAASITPQASVTTYNVKTSAVKNETAANAINIGALNEESAIISISDQGQAATGAVSTTFTAQPGTASLSEAFNNIVTQASTQFQLLDSSGNVIADNQGNTAQQTAYDAWVSGTLSLDAGTYTATATPDSAFGSTALSISQTEQQGTSLEVNSQLTGSDSSEYYNFSLSGNNLKLAFNPSTSTGTRVQVYNSKGALVADSAGNSFQKSNYQQLTSGTGLSATSGNYSVEVSYAPKQTGTPNINYNLQLYSGTNYAVVYKNNVIAQPTDNSAAGSVTATATAGLYTRDSFNKIGSTASGAVNIGWLAENKTSLNVVSQLTSADNADYYTLTLQTGNNLKFGFNSSQTTDAANLRVQILNSTGTQVIADNEGTAAQQAAYTALTTTNGLAAKPGNYVVKVSYANNIPKTTQNYDFSIYSGTSYAAEYRTIASAQTYGNAILSGSVGGAASAGMAAYLTAQSNGAAPDIISALKA
jgi:hypothetical protein